MSRRCAPPTPYRICLTSAFPLRLRQPRSVALPDIELCKERGFAVSLGEWRREIFGVAAPLYRTASGDCLSVNCGIPSFRFSAEQIERECGPRILGLARSIRSLVANEQHGAL
jgi:DNA-binding IclR family transcriptional regulator